MCLVLEIAIRWSSDDVPSMCVIGYDDNTWT